MSTRSGKRIHNSFREDTLKVMASNVTMSEIKTRSKKLKENCAYDSALKEKIRDNYVKYPTDDELDVDNKASKNRSLRKHTLLKEINFDCVVKIDRNNIIEKNANEYANNVRETRRTKKILHDNTDLELQEDKKVIVNEKRKIKKDKKKKASLANDKEVNIDNIKTNHQQKRSKGKKKKKNSLTKRDKVTEIDEDDKQSNTSSESYCTAVDSPEKHDQVADKQAELPEVHNETFDKSNISKHDSTFDLIKDDKKSSLISSDASDSKETTINVTFDKVDGISITSDDSKHSCENIVNTTPLIIDSSFENSKINDTTIDIKNDNAKENSNTSLKREGTFTKDGPDPIIMSPSRKKTPERVSLNYAGHTPYHSNGKKRQKSINLNLTHSIEKPAKTSLCAENIRRQTKVMFSSQVDDTTMKSQRKSRVIKSSMKGSNKSFVFDESLSSAVKPSPSRKRSLTHGDAEDRAKRARLTAELTNSVNRLSRPRTVSAIVKPTQTRDVATPSSKTGTPLLKSDTKSVRNKLPNFAALHQKQFEKMESLDECQERKAKRARQLMSPTGSLAVLERKNPKETSNTPTKTPINNKKINTPTKSVPKPTLDSLKPGYTRFGFKMNYSVNPFSVPPKKSDPETVSNLLKREPSQPSLKGTTALRKTAAKQTILREKSSTSLKDKRNEYRNIIKGVRTNRRFELQMKSRNINV